jgi:hypothetical protein
MLLLWHCSPLSVRGVKWKRCEMEELPGQHEDERAVPITYRAEIVAQHGGEEVRLGAGVRGSSMRELAESLIAQASEFESEAKGKLDRAESERGKSQRAELSGRRRRSWE